MTSIRATTKSATAHACPLCEGHGTVKHSVSQPTQRTDLLPWAIVLTAAAVVALVGLGAERWFGIGATSGVLSGAICAWITFRERRHAKREAHGAELKTLADDADQRVAMVIKQFEWAVNDVAKLKAELDRAQMASIALDRRARERERYVQRLERQLFETRDRFADYMAATQPVEVAEPVAAPGHVPFSWSMHTQGRVSTLELRLGPTSERPSRLRIVDRDGSVVAVSTPPSISQDGGIDFEIQAPPADLIADLGAGRDVNYAIEVLTQYEWKPVQLEDSGRRTKAVSDKQGRWYRVNDEPDSAPLLN